MMEVENRLSERFDGLVDELPDELNQKRVDNGVILEESEEEGDGMEGGVEGERLKSGGLHHPSGRIIKKVILVISNFSISNLVSQFCNTRYRIHQLSCCRPF